MVTDWSPLSYGIFIWALLLMNMHEGQTDPPIVNLLHSGSSCTTLKVNWSHWGLSSVIHSNRYFVSKWLKCAGVLLILEPVGCKKNGCNLTPTNYEKICFELNPGLFSVRGGCSQTESWSALPSLLPGFCGHWHSCKQKHPIPVPKLLF